MKFSVLKKILILVCVLNISYGQECEKVYKLADSIVKLDKIPNFGGIENSNTYQFTNPQGKEILIEATPMKSSLKEYSGLDWEKMTTCCFELAKTDELNAKCSKLFEKFQERRIMYVFELFKNFFNISPEKKLTYEISSVNKEGTPVSRFEMDLESSRKNFMKNGFIMNNGGKIYEISYKSDTKGFNSFDVRLNKISKSLHFQNGLESVILARFRKEFIEKRKWECKTIYSCFGLRFLLSDIATNSNFYEHSISNNEKYNRNLKSDELRELPNIQISLGIFSLDNAKNVKPKFGHLVSSGATQFFTEIFKEKYPDSHDTVQTFNEINNLFHEIDNKSDGFTEIFQTKYKRYINDPKSMNSIFGNQLNSILTDKCRTKCEGLFHDLITYKSFAMYVSDDSYFGNPTINLKESYKNKFDCSGILESEMMQIKYIIDSIYLDIKPSVMRNQGYIDFSKYFTNLDKIMSTTCHLKDDIYINFSSMNGKLEKILPKFQAKYNKIWETYSKYKSFAKSIDGALKTKDITIPNLITQFEKEFKSSFPDGILKNFREGLVDNLQNVVSLQLAFYCFAILQSGKKDILINFSKSNNYLDTNSPIFEKKTVKIDEISKEGVKKPEKEIIEKEENEEEILPYTPEKNNIRVSIHTRRLKKNRRNNKLKKSKKYLK